MRGQQSPYLLHGDGNGPGRPLRQSLPGFDGVGRLDPDEPGRGRQDAEAQCHHQGPGWGREVHIGQLVAAPLDAERANVEHLRPLHHHAAGWAPQVHRIHDEQQVHPAHQFLHQVDAPDAHLQDVHAVRQPLLDQRLGDGRPDAVVGAQHVAEAGDHSDHSGRVGVVAQPGQDSLVGRLGRYPADRYPVQHAATQFLLGSALLHAGQTAAALQALTVASEIFGSVGMRLEQSKAALMRGVALRTAGRHEEAAAALSAAGAQLGRLDQPAEQAAALFNLGLVLQDGGRPGAAREAWATARGLFLAAGHPAQAAAAAREQGASLLAAGDPSAAIPLLEQATTLAERCGDLPGMGAAANALGLAHLAEHNSLAALMALRWALSAFPHSVRPADDAMVRANLALAHEQAGDGPRARLAARQALSAPEAAGPVRAQAQQLLARLPGDASEDLLAVLDEDDQERAVPVLREEMLRASRLPVGQRQAIIRGFLDGLLTRPERCYDLAQSLLQVVLEFPPRTYELILSAVVDACPGRPEQDTQRLHAVICSAMARFAVPQWLRLAATLNAAAQQAGEPATWR